MSEIKPIWTEDGYDYILHLGTMRKAVCVRLYGPNNMPDRMMHEHFSYKDIKSNFYAISPASYFPFTNEQYSRKFDTAYEATVFAEDVIKDWIISIMNMGIRAESVATIQHENKLLTDG